MKQLVVFFDCHGSEILNYLHQNNFYNELYTDTHIILNDYVIKGRKFYDNNELDNYHIGLLHNADVVILQVIENDRGFLNNSNIEKYVTEKCIVIKIPHYRNSIYEYKLLEGYNDKYKMVLNWSLPELVKGINKPDEVLNIIKNQLVLPINYYSKNELQTAFDLKYNEFAIIDELSDIKMLKYYKDNWNKSRLFNGRRYPSSIFFYELVNNILIYLKLLPNKIYIDSYFGENTGHPIPEYWYKFCGFHFDNTYHIYKHIEIKEYEWYYILLHLNNADVIDENEINKYLMQIRNV
tara:strand:- start:1329 stop:2210 length:882 start_codon:yes stop_codon:yes gene_type:complete